MSFYLLTEVSRNQKLGPMPVVTVSAKTCPSSCPFANGGGCYAEYGPLNLLWTKVTNQVQGVDFQNLVAKVRRLPKMMWRYGQAGDLPGDGDTIDGNQLIELAKANASRPVLCYTHKPVSTHEQNANYIRKAEELGFHINISTESLVDCDDIVSAGFSAVTVIPASYQRGKNESLTDFKARVGELRTPKGTKVAICPATYTDTNCLKCGACSKRRAGNTVIAFPAHGTKKRVVDERITNASAKPARTSPD
ncbi:MAG: hypothetical protein Q4G24_03505 [Paracoccus sp. (in: a-proteobacteria)]|uniref:DUF7227 family protein n=1 Tax=Paracoccus sp. TaxID=267 RepID=UPI0026DEE4F5|nr:hypothetical protein [Paracoccus sp. (in: a-proteobacteria)]MDO5620518.1 hypothetical protein [Paracoccus sp. (in: a-proteobacteria)]